MSDEQAIKNVVGTYFLLWSWHAAYEVSKLLSQRGEIEPRTDLPLLHHPHPI